MNGVILIDKPKEFTSFDVIAVMRKLCKQKKAGHTGTLDPNATGVLPVLLGCATKALDLIENHDKTYIADFKLGMTSDTLDIWGNVTESEKTHIIREKLENTLENFVGEIEQIPPMFSAVQINGQRLYDLARKGIDVERESRKVTVYNATLLDFDAENQSGQIEVSCSKGTYIRTIIDDIGKALGCGAVMSGLRRTKACGFSIDECITLEKAKELAENGTLESRLILTERLFMNYEQILVSEAQARRFKNGGALDIGRTALKNRELVDGKHYRVKSRDGEFLGLGIVDLQNGAIKVLKLFPLS